MKGRCKAIHTPKHEGTYIKPMFKSSCNTWSYIALGLKITLDDDGSLYRNNAIPLPLGTAPHVSLDLVGLP